MPLLISGGCGLILGLDAFEDAPVGGDAGAGGEGGAVAAGGGGAGGSSGTPSGDAIWARIHGDDTSQTPTAVAVDPGGNTFITGLFSGAIEFGQQILISAGSNDVFLSKLDPAGNALWSRQFGDSFNQSPHGVATDSAGNVVVVGTFDGAIDLGDGPLQNQGARDGFVAKFDASGDLAWSNQIASQSPISVTDVAIDPSSGDVIVVGSFEGSIDYGDGSISSTGAGDRDAFIARLASSTGASVWWRDYGDGADQQLNAVTIDPAGNIVAGGYFSGTMVLGNTSLSSGTSAEDIVVARFDSAGNVDWAKRFGSDGFDRLYGISADPTGAIAMTGHIEGSVDFGCGPLAHVGGVDAFLTRLNSVGQCSWSKAIGGPGDEDGYEVAAGADGGVIVAGSFDQTIQVDGETLTSRGSYDVMLARFTAAGALVWTRSIGDSGYDLVSGVAVAPADTAVLIAGSTSGSWDLGTVTVTSAGSSDVVVAKLAP